jgi:hypothetical protein
MSWVSAPAIPADGSGALLLHLHVSPGASRQAVEGWRTEPDGTQRLRVRVAAPPEKGRANQAVIRLLADLLQVAPRDIQVVRGEISRAKTVQIAGDEATLRRQLPPHAATGNHPPPASRQGSPS